jgi:endonuclease/exonuclease/phosphatase family metal-dependent hydrolase
MVEFCMRSLKLIHLLSIPFLFLTFSVHATTVQFLQANLYSWYTMDTKKNPVPIIKMTSYINSNNFDFITTQENDYPLTDALYKLDAKYKLAGNREDASLFYDSSRWAIVDNSRKTISMTSDGGGARVAVFSKFRNLKSGEQIAIGSTHLCIAWGGHADCVGGQVTAHTTDARKIGEYLETYSSTDGIPTFVTGDFNNLQDNLNQAQIIEATLVNYGFAAVKSGGTFIGPTFGGSVIDFVYSRQATLKNAVLYTQSQGNPSDHAAINVTYEIGQK